MCFSSPCSRVLEFSNFLVKDTEDILVSSCREGDVLREMMVWQVFLSFLFSRVVEAYTPLATHDLVPQLPSAVILNFSIFSGYLSIANTLIDEIQVSSSVLPQNDIVKMIHYVYVESQSDPQHDPIIFWTNGGPGCSGLVGFFTEMGPWRPMQDENENIYLVQNPYAWNKHANIVYLEQPVGVGFSYIIDDNPDTIGDQTSVDDILKAIIEFFDRFPERKSNSLYFASESYGGHYIPELALRLLKSGQTEMKSNLKGLIIGNPFVSFGTGFLSRGIAFWNFQLIPRSLWLQYQVNACDNMDLLVDQFTETCWNILSAMFDKASPYLDLYGANFPTCNMTNNEANASFETPMKVLSSSFPHSSIRKQRSAQEYLKEVLQFQRSPQFISRVRQTTIGDSHRRAEDSREWFDDDNEDAMRYVECSSVYMGEYLNRQDVKVALHVDPTLQWNECSDPLFYNWPLTDLFGNKIPLYKELLSNNTQLDVLVFSGDSDIICPTIGTQHWVFGLGLEVKSLWRPWLRRNQTAGYLTQFSHRFSFLTVHSAGHMIPRYQPGRGYDVISRYLQGDWFSYSKEGIILSCGYALVIEDLDGSISESETYLYINWAVRYIFDSFTAKHSNDVLDIWDINVYELQDGELSDDDDDSARSRQRILKKGRQPTITSSTHPLIIILDILVPNYEMGVTIKTALDTYFQASMASRYQLFLKVLRFMYLQQLKYASIDSFISELDFYGIKILSSQTLSGYDMELLPLSSRPSLSKEDEYYFKNITWTQLEMILNGTAVDEESSQSSEADPWYHHLLILTSKLDVGDILLLFFLPLGILFGVLFLFQTYQSVHDRFLNEMGYEIHYVDSEGAYNQRTSTSPTLSYRQNKGQSQIEMGTY